MNNKIIINADDCGYSKKVNFAIEECIKRKKITSTTIMSNMEDFAGAKRLFNDYKDDISFGAHLNLTEGKPLLSKSQILLDLGMYKEEDGQVLFSGKEWRFTQIPKEAKREVKIELDLQLQKLMDNGISVSHIDSHHHIHTGIPILPIIIDLAKKYHINGMRNIRNYMPLNASYIGRRIWNLWLHFLYPQVATSDYFCSYSEFYNLTKEQGFCKSNSIIELMVHPGGIYPDEEKLYSEVDIEKEFSDTLINYNQI